MSDINYEQLIEEANHPQNQNPIKTVDAVSKSINSSCGDTVIVSVKYSQDGKIIDDISWQGTGCIVSRAGMSVLSEMAKGKTRAELLKLTPESIMESLGLDNIAPGRVKCLTLGLSALKQLS